MIGWNGRAENRPWTAGLMQNRGLLIATLHALHQTYLCPQPITTPAPGIQPRLTAPTLLLHY
jgi:hypothetical protein